jgi:histidinol-phosphatase (PHP family)
MEEYLLQAIANGTRYFGFSEHAYMDFDPGYRMKKEEMAPYEAEIDLLKEKYKDRITLLKGYEVDYLPGHMDADVLNADVDYLIGSVHFLDGWGFDNPEFIGGYATRNIDEIWREYFEAIGQMAQSRLFDIVGHLDLIKVFKYMPKGDLSGSFTQALKHIKASDMSIELNPAGLRKKIGEPYPSTALLKMAFDMAIPVTFGSDAHKPSDVGFGSSEIVKLARDTGYRECMVYFKRKGQLIKF